MSFWQFLQANWSELLLLVRQHIVLVFFAILVAVIIGVPVGIGLTRYRALRGPVLGIANVMQTIPSLALFGFLIPLPFIGGIGTRTALVALVLYSLLPIIRNTVTGILGVDPNVREAAVAMGMTDSQVLRQVELPLAMGVIVTGIRVATVIAVGVTTIAAAVGAGGLGVYIFRGLRQYDNNLLLAGALSAALLALAADFFLGLLERQFSFDAKHTVAKGPVARKLAMVAAIVLVVGGVVLWLGRSTPASESRASRSDRKTSPNPRCLPRSLRRCSRRAEFLSNGVLSSAETCPTKPSSPAHSISIPNTPARPSLRYSSTRRSPIHEPSTPGEAGVCGQVQG